MVIDDVVWILEANRPETRRNTDEWQIILTWDLGIPDTEREGIVHQLEVNSSSDNSDLNPEAKRPEICCDS